MNRLSSDSQTATIMHADGMGGFMRGIVESSEYLMADFWLNVI